MMEGIKGYKVFNPDWTCRGYQYKVGETFEEDVSPECCRKGFHFCKEMSECFGCYPVTPESRFAEVIALGDIDETIYGDKSCTNKIHIVREISWEEALWLLDIEEQNT